VASQVTFQSVVGVCSRPFGAGIDRSVFGCARSIEQNAEVVVVGLCSLRRSGLFDCTGGSAKLSSCRRSVYSNNGSFSITQTSVNPDGWQSSSQVPPQLFSVPLFSGNRVRWVSDGVDGPTMEGSSGRKRQGFSRSLVVIGLRRLRMGSLAS
jgi:hypothetical protein